MNLTGTELERTRALVGLTNDPTIREEVRSLLALLVEYTPDAKQREQRGSTLKQVIYIASLANFSTEDTGKLYLALDMCGGLSRSQASYLIDILKERRRNYRVSSG